MLAMEKCVKYGIQKELVVLIDRIDGLKVHVQNNLQGEGLEDDKEFKAQLAEIQAEIEKPDDKPNIVDDFVVPESLISLYSEPPTSQELDDIWGDVSTEKSNKTKQMVGEFDGVQPTNLSKDEMRQHKKAHKESRRLARKTKTLEK